MFLTDFIRDGFRRELLHVLNRGESVNALLELATAAQVVSDAGATAFHPIGISATERYPSLIAMVGMLSRNSR